MNKNEKSEVEVKCELESAYYRFERSIYSLNYDGYFTKSFFNEFRETLGLLSAFRMFYKGEVVDKIHEYHAMPDMTRDDNCNSIIYQLRKSIRNSNPRLIPNKYILSDCPNEYPSCQSKVEIAVCSCSEYSSLGCCYDEKLECHINNIQSTIILYSTENTKILKRFFDGDTFENVREVFKKYEEPNCFGSDPACKDDSCGWFSRCRPSIARSGKKEKSSLDLDEILRQLKDKFQVVLRRRDELPILIYNSSTRLLTYRAVDYLKLPQLTDWTKYKDNAFACVSDDKDNKFNIIDEIKLCDELLRCNQHTPLIQSDLFEINEKKIKDIKDKYIECFNKLIEDLEYSDNIDSFIDLGGLNKARVLLGAVAQRVNTGLTKDLWQSFESYNVSTENLNIKDSIKNQKGERLRIFCERLFFPLGERMELICTPLGYLGQKLGIVFVMVPEDNESKEKLEKLADNFNNIGKDFGPLLFHSLQAKTYQVALSILNDRNPLDVINIICESLPTVFNVTAVVYRVNKKELHPPPPNQPKDIFYGFKSPNEGTVFGLLDHDKSLDVINELRSLDDLESILSFRDGITSYSYDGLVYTCSFEPGNKIRTRSRLLLNINSAYFDKLPVPKGILDIHFDLSEYSLRRNVTDIVREIEFLIDLIFEAATQKYKVMQQALLTAVSAIMGRNMSHNIGSHVLARYSSIIKEESLQPAESKEDKPDFRAEFLSYLQRRMDFLAEIATSEQSFWSQPLSIKDEVQQLNYTVQQNRFFGNSNSDLACTVGCNFSVETGKRGNRPILLSYITGKESLLASVEFGLPESRCQSTKTNGEGGYQVNNCEPDYLFSCPGGEVGIHALFVILENIIRNSARHGNDTACKIVKIFLHVDSEGSTDSLLKLIVIDPRTPLTSEGHIIQPKNIAESESEKEPLPLKINSILRESFLNVDGQPKPHNWGVREIQICAHYLQGLPLLELERRASDDTALTAGLHSLGNGTYCLKYELYVPRPKLMTIVSDNFNDNYSSKFNTEKGIQVLRSNCDSNLLAENAKGYSFLVIEESDSIRSKYDISLASFPVRTIFASIEIIKQITVNAFNSNNLLWMEALHKAVAEVYRDKRGFWENKPINGVVVKENLPSGSTPKISAEKQLIWVQGGREGDGYSDLIPLPDILRDWHSLLKEKIIAAAWIDHPHNYDFTANNGPMFGQSGYKPESNRPEYLWVCAEAAFSESPHSAYLITAQKEGLQWELLASAMSRVVMIDERIQSEVASRFRGIELQRLWRCMGVWVPKKDSCDLDSTNFECCRKFLLHPPFREDQYPIDFLVIHLTILERLKRLGTYQTLNAVLSELIKDTQAKDAQVIVVTGRGVPSAALSLDPDHLSHARYLPISAVHASLVLQPSKLSLMRVLWSSGSPNKKFSDQ